MDQTPRQIIYGAFGDYVRSQRQLAQLSLRQAADLARISNPYLSQIEHGMALPSVTVIRALAEALHLSADTLLLRAAGVASDDEAGSSVATEVALRLDPRLSDAQKLALLGVLAQFVGSSGSRSMPTPAEPTPAEPTPADNGAAPAVIRTPRRRQPPKAQITVGEVHDDA